MKRASTFLLLLLLGLLGRAQAQTAAATWPLTPTTTTQATTTGSISAASETIGNYFAATPSNISYRTAAPASQVVLLNPGGVASSSAIAHNSGGYLQFEVSPLAGQSLTVNSLSLNIGGNNNSLSTSIEYSTSPTFANPTVIAAPSGTSVFTTNAVTPFSYSLPNIQVASGNKFYVRVYAWHTQTAARYMFINNVVIGSNNATPVNGVTVVDNGTTVTLNNTIVSVQITKATGAISTFNYNGANILTGGFSGGQFYWSWNMPNYQNPANCTYTLTADPATNGNDYAEVKLHMTWDGTASTAAMDVDIYYSLKKNVSGLYATAKLSHPAAYPANPGGEFRMASYPGATYDWLNVDADRSRLMPNLADHTAAVAVPGAPAEVVRLTSGPFANTYECKYDYSADFGDINTWGWTSTTNNTGLWMTAPSKEYYPGGPMKRELMCHASPVLLNMVGGTHYITGLETDVAAGETWSKIYGPFLIYCNKVASGTPNANAALWNDAKAQALAEQAQWPYNWLTEPDYVKANGRGTVTGTLVVSDAGATPSAANVWVGVAATPVASNTTDFQFWSKNYQFWVKTDANGNFTIPDVLPGTYNLYAFGPSAIGYMTRTNYVTVTAGATAALGTVTWTPGRQAPTIWEIGTPDRTSKEFKHGTDYWVQGSYPDPNWANFMRYKDEFPNEVNYTIGTSNPATDWNYVQPYNIVGTAQTVAPEWKVNFSLATAPTASSTASIYVAAASFFAGPLIVKVNGTNITTPSTGISFPNSSNATIRMANHGTFSDLRFNFPASLLVAGANQITFTNRRVAGDIQYDYLRLEAAGTSVAPDLEVTTGAITAPTAVPAGVYNSLTVTGSGVAQLTGATTVVNRLVVQAGGTLLTNCQPLTGPASFTLASGATLGICDPAGLSTAAATGAVQTTGARSFSTDASYLYNGTQAQATGDALPSQVRNLTTTNSQSVTLSGAVRITQVLTVGAAGDLVTAGNTLTLASDATGTALVVNSSTGVVSGAATVQRYIDGSINPGAGYRQYAAPVTNTTVADLATTGYAPTVNAAYNNSSTPGSVTPFPTVYGYDQSRLATVNNNLSAFDKGWYSPSATTDALAPGFGYTVNIGAAQLVDFVGTLGTGTLPMNLARNSGATAADGGWALVGNPYPAPLDWSKVAAADRANLDNAIYVQQSSGQYTGSYRSYVNGQSTTGTNNPLITSSQGFFVRVSQGQTSGSLTFRNSQRVASYADQTAFQRGTADLRPALRLSLSGAGVADGWVAYAETGASAGFDGQYDAAKLPNSTGLNLSSTSRTGQQFSIDGQAAFTTATVLPLAVGVPAAGTYTLTAAAIDNMPVGLVAYLRDAVTNQVLPLTPSTSYHFSVTTVQASALMLGRFTVQFAPTAPLATTSAALASAVALYPNPAHQAVTVTMPGVTGATTVQVEILNGLGQLVLRQQAVLPAAGTTLTLPTAYLAAGVYIVRLRAGETLVSKRLIVQ
jgi:hypothetical protein